jgi:protein-disulfide isomerase
MEHEASHYHQSGGGKDYILPAVILLSALMVSGAIWYGASGVTSSVNDMKAAVLELKSISLSVPNLPTTGGTAQQAPAATPTPGPVNINLGDHPVFGDPNAKVTIVEFSDFQCPFCKSAFPTVQQIMTDYKGKVKLYYFHFPLPFHVNAEISAEAYECARDQGKQSEYHDAMFTYGQSDGTNLTSTDLKRYAKDLGLNAVAFNSCLDGGSKKAYVQADETYGSQLGVGGTPTFFINGVELVGAQPYAAFKQQVDTALAG